MTDLDPSSLGPRPSPRRTGGRLRSFASSHLRRSGLTAFVLAGGGTRGAVQVGMLAELVDRGIRADRVYGAVSYTHLDVYKRQPWSSGPSGTG